MGGYDNEFNAASPVGSDLASDIDIMIQAGSKSATAERFALEHVPLDSSATGANDKNNSNAQGRHVPGMVSVLLADTTANITAFVAANQPPTGTGVGVGAIALDTTLGQLQRFNGTAFVNLGLSTTIYTAGDGILLVGQEFAIDPADADDMLAATSLAKVVTPAMAKWSYGSTEYINMVTLYNATSSELTENDYTTVPLDAPEINTITGSSIDTGANTFTLPVGVYTIKVQVGTFAKATSDASSDLSMTGRLVNITNGNAVVTYLPPHVVYGSRDDDRTTSSHVALRTIEVVVSEVTVFQLSVWTTTHDNDSVARFFDGTTVPAGFLTTGVPVHALEIWKKKVVAT